MLIIIWKKSLLNFIYKFDNVEFECVFMEKDVGVNIINFFIWNIYIYVIIVKVNKLFGFLKCMCLLLNDVFVRCLFYFVFVKL